MRNTSPVKVPQPNDWHILKPLRIGLHMKTWLNSVEICQPYEGSKIKG